MHWFLGVDGGGTRTRFALIDQTGRLGGETETGAGNFHHAELGAVRREVRKGIDEVCRACGAESNQIRAAFFGMAGVTSEPSRQTVRELASDAGLSGAAVGVDHDIRIALAGGLAGSPGIALIVGTGSSCYGRNQRGESWQTGGWGALIADEGSGYQLGRTAIAAAAQMADGRRPESPLRAAVFGWLGIRTVAEIMHRLYEQELTRAQIAAFAPQLIALATQGDPVANELLDEGAAAVAEMAAANHRQLPTGPAPDVVLAGGLGQARTVYRVKLDASLRQRLPQVRVREPELSPARGAALLAFEAVEGKATEEFLRNLASPAGGGREAGR